jgi:hypothetical protein
MSHDYDRREASTREADSAANRVRNVKPWLTSASRDLKRAEQVLTGVQKEFEVFSRHDRKAKDALADITDITQRVANFHKGAEALIKEIDDFARRNR